jgi:holo-[acyl-carrier protein] synthase
LCSHKWTAAYHPVHLCEIIIPMSGIGVDLCCPKRIEKIYKNFGKKFLGRIFTEREIKDLEKSLSKKYGSFHRIAGRFAAKEAISKALGTGIGKKLSFKDIEITHDEKGSPLVALKNSKQKVSVTISHEKSMAVAFAILVD